MLYETVMSLCAGKRGGGSRGWGEGLGGCWGVEEGGG